MATMNAYARLTYGVLATMIAVAGIYAIRLHANDQAALSQVRTQLDDMKSTLADVTASLHQPLSQPWPNSPAAYLPSVAAPSTLPMASAEPSPTRGHQHRISSSEARANLDTEFDVGAAPSPETRELLREARQRLESLLPHSARVDSFDCREAMCRVEVSGVPREQVRAFEQSALNLNSPTNVMAGPELFVTQVDNEGKAEDANVIAYIATEGHKLPRMPRESAQ